MLRGRRAVRLSIMAFHWLASAWCWLANTVVCQPDELTREQSQRAAIALVLLPLIGALLSFALLRYYGQLIRQQRIDEKRTARLVILIVIGFFGVLTVAFFLYVGLMR